MDVVIHHPGCDLEDVLKKCPDLTWNQVFITVNQLSRQGYVSVRVGNGRTEPRHDAYSCAKEKELDAHDAPHSMVHTRSSHGSLDPIASPPERPSHIPLGMTGFDTIVMTLTTS